MSIIRAASIFILVTIFATISTFNTAKAQSFDWGLSGGMTVSSHLKKFWYIEDDIRLRLSPDVALGYKAGFVTRYSFSRVLRLQAEPSLILLGAKYDDSFSLRGTQFETDSRTELTYIQLPLLLQLSTAPKQQTVYGRKSSQTTFHLSGGVFGGYLLDAQFKGTNSGAPLGIEFEGAFSNDVKRQYSDYDAGAIFGLGFEHGFYQKLGFEARAQFSIIDSGSDQIYFFRPQNMALTFSLYYLF